MTREDEVEERGKEYLGELPNGEEVRGTGDTASTGTERMNVRIGWIRVEREKVMDALNKENISIGCCCSGNVEKWLLRIIRTSVYRV